MLKAVLSISGNVYKQQEMDIDTVLSEIESNITLHLKKNSSLPSNPLTYVYDVNDDFSVLQGVLIDNKVFQRQDDKEVDAISCFFPLRSRRKAMCVLHTRK